MLNGTSIKLLSVGKACCRSLLLIGCRFKCFWGSPHRPPGPGAMFGQRDRWAAFQELYTLSSPHTLLYIHKLFYFLCNAFHGTYPVGLYFVQYQEEGVLLQFCFEFFCTAWGLKWRAGFSDALYVHLVALHFGCTASPLCTGSKLHWSNILTLNCV